MDLDAAVVVNEAQFSKFVHEETHAGPGRANHFRKRLLADVRPSVPMMMRQTPAGSLPLGA
jgi:hypothetical protein